MIITGYMTATSRTDPVQHDERASAARQGRPVVSVVVKVALSVWQSARFAHAYGVAWYEVPLAWVLALVVHCLEVPGMIDALRGRRIVKTLYR